MRFPEGDMNASNIYNSERTHYLSRCLDRNICTWLASFVSETHTPTILQVLEQGIIYYSIPSLGGQNIPFHLPGQYLPSSFHYLGTRLAVINDTHRVLVTTTSFLSDDTFAAMCAFNPTIAVDTHPTLVLYDNTVKILPSSI